MRIVSRADLVSYLAKACGTGFHLGHRSRTATSEGDSTDIGLLVFDCAISAAQQLSNCRHLRTARVRLPMIALASLVRKA